MAQINIHQYPTYKDEFIICNKLFINNRVGRTARGTNSQGRALLFLLPGTQTCPIEIFQKPESQETVPFSVALVQKSYRFWST